MASDAKPVVSFLGPVASFSHQAVRQTFSEDGWVLRPVTTIDDVFDQVQQRQALLGVVPFENSTNGSVVFTLDNLADRNGRHKDVSVNGEIYIKVEHCLLGHKAPVPAPAASTPNSGADSPAPTDPTLQASEAQPLNSLRHIKRLYSHPQAFGQCHAFISAHLKEAETFDTNSTSQAAEIVSRDQTGTWAAISNIMAADVQGLQVLHRAIQDLEDNTTRFLVIGSSPSLPKDDRLLAQPQLPGSKSLISFTVPHSSPGALAVVLGCFHDFNLNLTSINSRPSLLEPFQYIFFVEFEGHRLEDADGRVQGALHKIGLFAENSRWLGSWRRCR
ncbi:hypothetical protein CDD82_6884 [Ophiocordyceps australis]|uniref:prephenate dehydratase n=1 Tax=Ophiocordyceps australis TaxID=1399860 RepID=A0A2C5XFU3_9HYPO|nr:hypothetical protein CDD82_6884 [Ophiocordyceps australis]